MPKTAIPVIVRDDDKFDEAIENFDRLLNNLEPFDGIYAMKKADQAEGIAIIAKDILNTRVSEKLLDNEDGLTEAKIRSKQAYYVNKILVPALCSFIADGRTKATADTWIEAEYNNLVYEGLESDEKQKAVASKHGWAA